MRANMPKKPKVITRINCRICTPAIKSMPRKVENISAEVPISGCIRIREETNTTNKAGLKKANQWDCKSLSLLTEYPAT